MVLPDPKSLTTWEVNQVATENHGRDLLSCLPLRIQGYSPLAQRRQCVAGLRTAEAASASVHILRDSGRADTPEPGDAVALPGWPKQSKSPAPKNNFAAEGAPGECTGLPITR